MREVGYDPLLHKGRGTLCPDPEKCFKLMVTFFELLLALVVYLQYGTVFQRHHEHSCRLLQNIAVVVGYPPIFYRKCNGAVLAIVIYHIGPESPAQNVMPVVGHIVGLNDELSFFDLHFFETATKPACFINRQTNVPAYVFYYFIVVFHCYQYRISLCWMIYN